MLNVTFVSLSGMLRHSWEKISICGQFHICGHHASKLLAMRNRYLSTFFKDYIWSHNAACREILMGPCWSNGYRKKHWTIQSFAAFNLPADLFKLRQGRFVWKIFGFQKVTDKANYFLWIRPINQEGYYWGITYWMAGLFGDNIGVNWIGL